MASRLGTILLYRDLMREANKFKSFNLREYAKRRISEGFRENRNETDPGKIQELIAFGESQLEMLKRQTAVQNFYHKQQLVIEH